MHIHTYIHIHICAEPAASVFEGFPVDEQDRRTLHELLPQSTALAHAVDRGRRPTQFERGGHASPPDGSDR